MGERINLETTPIIEIFQHGQGLSSILEYLSKLLRLLYLGKCTHTRTLLELMHSYAALDIYAPPTSMLLTGMCTVEVKVSGVKLVHKALENRYRHLSISVFNGIMNVLSFTTYPIIPITTKPTPTA